MLRRSPLRARRPVSRPITMGWPKRELHLAQLALDRARQAEEHAKTWGCEYAGALRERFKLFGCELCGRTRAICHLHHTRAGRVRRAESLVPLCHECHRLGHDRGWQGLEARFGVDLLVRAAELAGQGQEDGWLPCERCSTCGTWHSTKLLLDLVTTESTSRVCTGCAPEGPR